MVQRTTITPNQTDIHLSVPQNYVGRKLEILLYPVDELTDGLAEELPKKKPSDFAGTINKEEGEKFHDHLKQAPNKWDKDF